MALGQGLPWQDHQASKPILSLTSLWLPFDQFNQETPTSECTHTNETHKRQMNKTRLFFY